MRMRGRLSTNYDVTPLLIANFIEGKLPPTVLKISERCSLLTRNDFTKTGRHDNNTDAWLWTWLILDIAEKHNVFSQRSCLLSYS